MEVVVGFALGAVVGIEGIASLACCDTFLAD